jgi:hypothetical protein
MEEFMDDGFEGFGKGRWLWLNKGRADELQV